MNFRLVLALLLFGCSASHEPAPPSTTADAGPMSPCPPGWVPEPGACARWVPAAPYPAERCEPGTVAEPAIGLYGGPMVRCGELGFSYRATSDDWAEERGATVPADDWSETLPARRPGEERLVAPLWGDRLLVLQRRFGSEWLASRVDFLGTDLQPTAPPTVAPVAVLPLGSSQAIAAGADGSAIYERMVR